MKNELIKKEEYLKPSITVMDIDYEGMVTSSEVDSDGDVIVNGYENNIEPW